MEESSSETTTRKMIPVMTSTKIDKSTIDLAGVEAGAKMFVPGEYEPDSLAHPVTAGKKRRSIVRARNGNVEDLICGIDISLLPFFIFQMLVLPAGVAISSHYFTYAKLSPGFSHHRTRFNGHQACCRT